MKNKLRIIDLGKKSFPETYQIQLELVARRYRGEIEDTLILVEHPPIFTIGRGGSRENITVPEDFLARKGIEVYEIDRGGDITYHGPGQLVGYPIINLKGHRQDLHWLLRTYEEVFIRMLQNEYNLQARRIENLTGVWIKNKKITALGIGVKRWVTYHGFALNIDPDLEHFSYIIPCGIFDKGVTSLKEVLNIPMEMKEVKEQVKRYFTEVFEMELIK